NRGYECHGLRVEHSKSRGTRYYMYAADGKRKLWLGTDKSKAIFKWRAAQSQEQNVIINTGQTETVDWPQFTDDGSIEVKPMEQQIQQALSMSELLLSIGKGIYENPELWAKRLGVPELAQLHSLKAQLNILLSDIFSAFASRTDISPKYRHNVTQA